MVFYKSWRRTSADGKWRCKSVTVCDELVWEAWEWIGDDYSKQQEQPEDKTAKDDKGRSSQGSKSQGSKGAKRAKSKQVKKQLAGKTTKSK